MSKAREELFPAAATREVRVDRLWWDGDRIRGVVYGKLPSKANSRKIVTVGNARNRRFLVIKSEEARDYEEQFKKAAQRSALSGIPLEGMLSIDVTVVQQDMRRDLDIELLCDVLQGSGVIGNDRWLWRKVSERDLDKNCPRVEFSLGKLADTLAFPTMDLIRLVLGWQKHTAKEHAIEGSHIEYCACAECKLYGFASAHLKDLEHMSAEQRTM